MTVTGVSPMSILSQQTTQTNSTKSEITGRYQYVPGEPVHFLDDDGP